jgi:hypothetical protein
MGRRLMERARGALIFILALSGCGVLPDDPSNIPLKGKWSDESRVMSVAVNGAAMRIEDFESFAGEPIKLPPKGEFCGEPKFADRTEMQKLLRDGHASDCDVVSMDVNGAKITAKAQCTLVNMPEVEGNATVTHDVRQKSDRVEFDVVVNSVGRLRATGTGETVKLEIRRTMTRIGDC